MQGDLSEAFAAFLSRPQRLIEFQLEARYRPADRSARSWVSLMFLLNWQQAKFLQWSKRGEENCQHIDPIMSLLGLNKAPTSHSD